MTPNGGVVWHNGSTSAFETYLGLQLAKLIGVVVLNPRVQTGVETTEVRKPNLRTKVRFWHQAELAKVALAAVQAPCATRTRRNPSGAGAPALHLLPLMSEPAVAAKFPGD